MSYDPVSKVNIMVCHSGICLLTFGAGAITVLEKNTQVTMIKQSAA